MRIKTLLLTAMTSLTCVGLACVSTAQAAAPKGPTPSNNPGTWIGADDYPKDALAAGAEGAVAFDVTVGADGVPTGCTVTTGSGSAALDEATCRLVSTPDAGGKAEAGHYRNKIRWVLPEQTQPVLIVPRAGPWMWSRDCRVLADGDPAAALRVIASATCN
jgi:TonB family protein